MIIVMSVVCIQASVDEQCVIQHPHHSLHSLAPPSQGIQDAEQTSCATLGNGPCNKIPVEHLDLTLSWKEREVSTFLHCDLIATINWHKQV